jgi:hypothetical protein
MNRSLAENIRRKLMPALESSQGVQGSYCRGQTVVPLTAIPTNPDWESETDRGTVIEEYTELLFVVSIDQWDATGFNLPEQSDRFTCILPDGRARTYALLAKKGARPYSLDATGTNYALRMKWVKA